MVTRVKSKGNSNGQECPSYKTQVPALLGGCLPIWLSLRPQGALLDEAKRRLESEPTRPRVDKPLPAEVTGRYSVMSKWKSYPRPVKHFGMV